MFFPLLKLAPMKNLLITISLFAICTSTHSMIEELKVEYYDVQVGNSVPAPSYVRQFAPKCYDEVKDVGCFQWTIHTKYDIFWNKNGCTVKKPQIKFIGLMILPRFITTNEEIHSKLESFTKNLVVHEEGHAEIVRNAAKEFETQMSEIGWKKTCDEVKSSVIFERDLIIQKAKLKNKIYDKETNYGETQGAILLQ